MGKALFQKQMMEVFSWVYQNKKSGKNRSALGIAGYVVLYLIIFGFLGGVFYFVADMLCKPLAAAGFGWLYFAIMGLLGVFFGVFGSVFNTYASLYQAKDNDLLLSMPIPAGKILMVRLLGVYAMGLMYELIVMIPTVIVWFLAAELSVAGVIFSLFIPVVLSVLILVLSAVLGWVVALISVKLKQKNIMIAVLSLAFIAAYYYFYSRAYSMLQSILAAPEAIGGKIKSIVYPIYHMGLAAEGSISSMLIFTGIVLALFAIVYLVLSYSFLKIATGTSAGSRTKYKEKHMVQRSAESALFHKELGRFLGSANYMLNCGLGIIMMPLGAGFLLWKGDMVREVLNMVFAENKGVVGLIAVAAACMVAAMNDITAPSVSLEGKNLWLVQVFPVTGKQVLMAKIKLHLVLTLIPAAVLVAAEEWVLKPEPAFAVLIPVLVVVFTLFMATFGLFINLKMPNLNWTSEIVPIKQSMGVMLVLFGSWAVVAAMAGLYFLLRDIMSPLIYGICAGGVLLVAVIYLFHWIRTKGAEIFETL